MPSERQARWRGVRQENWGRPQGEPIFLLTLEAPAHGRGLKLPEGDANGSQGENLAFPETGNGVGFVLAIFYELEGGGAKRLPCLTGIQ